jgi:hypothetical protein
VAARAVQIGALTYRSIASILANRLEAARSGAGTIVEHANVRGPGYFH